MGLSDVTLAHTSNDEQAALEFVLEAIRYCRKHGIDGSDEALDAVLRIEDALQRNGDIVLKLGRRDDS